MSRQLVEQLQRRFGAAILREESRHGDEAVWVGPADLLPVLEYLRQHETCELLADVIAVLPDTARDAPVPAAGRCRPAWPALQGF